jgi:NtrC-family two-component system response regulator AlgB
MEIQPKLLRLLQEREYERLGENKVREANVRVIAATNRDLKACIAEGHFREDLYYRLNVISVTVPALRDRPADLARFAKDYLDFFAGQLGRKIDGFSESGRTALMRHPWPGNLRELRNAIERATILARGSTVEAEDLPRPGPFVAAGTNASPDALGIGGEHSLEEIEQAHLMKVLDWAPSLHDAASVLGIDKATLYRKRKRFGID